MFEINGETYEMADMLESAMDGVCQECGETTYGHEPDARENWCPCCEANAVVSVLELALDAGVC